MIKLTLYAIGCLALAVVGIGLLVLLRRALAAMLVVGLWVACAVAVFVTVSLGIRFLDFITLQRFAVFRMMFSGD